MITSNYGKYTVPTLLQQVISFQHQLSEQGLLPYGDLFGYYFAVESVESRYLNTPLDVIPFARPGVDGIHIGFLTDFGQVPDLLDAYIVRVMPMNFDQPVEIIARNFQDFLRLLCFHPRMLDTGDSSFDDTVQSSVHQLFSERFHLKAFNHVSDYFKQLHRKRAQTVSFPTFDGIGVISEFVEPHENLSFFHFDQKDLLLLEEVQAFFEESSYVAKCAFLRDAQSKGLVWDNLAVKEFLKQQLIQIGLPDEAERIGYPVH